MFGLEGGAKRSIITTSQIEVNKDLLDTEYTKKITHPETYKRSGSISSSEISKKANTLGNKSISSTLRRVTSQPDEIIERSVGDALKKQRVGPLNHAPMAKALLKMAKGAAPVLVGLATYKLIQEAFKDRDESKLRIGSDLTAYKA